MDLDLYREACRMQCRWVQEVIVQSKIRGANGTNLKVIHVWKNNSWLKGQESSLGADVFRANLWGACKGKVASVKKLLLSVE